MAWSVKTPYAMFRMRRGKKEMIAHHDSVLDKPQMEALWNTGTPITCSGVECEKFDVRDLDLRFAEYGLEGSYGFFWFEDINDNTVYPMFASDAAKLLEKDMLRHDITGTFEIVRHGAHFGIVMTS